MRPLWLVRGIASHQASFTRVHHRRAAIAAASIINNIAPSATTTASTQVSQKHVAYLHSKAVADSRRLSPFGMIIAAIQEEISLVNKR